MVELFCSRCVSTIYDKYTGKYVFTFYWWFDFMKSFFMAESENPRVSRGRTIPFAKNMKSKKQSENRVRDIVKVLPTEL